MAAAHKNSIKRNAILQELCSSLEHPTAEMIYEQLKPVYPDLSLGTVYRNLAMFCEEGMAHSVGNVCGKERFDGRLDEHSHFVCRQCSRVLDVELTNSAEQAYDKINDELNCSVEKCSVVFTGLCERCRINK